MGVCVLQLSQTIADLRKQLQNTALAQGNEIFRTINDASLLQRMKDAAASGNLDRLEEKTNDYTEHTEQLQEVRSNRLENINVAKCDRGCREFSYHALDVTCSHITENKRCNYNGENLTPQKIPA